MHDLLFSDQKALDEPSLLRRAGILGLDLNRFRECRGDKADERIRADLLSGRELGITGTPTFLIGTVDGDRVNVGARLRGAVPISRFEEALESIQKGYAQQKGR